MRAVRACGKDAVIANNDLHARKGVSWLLLCTSKEVTRSLKASGTLLALYLSLVIPAKAGIQLLSQVDEGLDPSLRWDDEQRQSDEQKTLDSGFRRNDEHVQRTGSRLSPG